MTRMRIRLVRTALAAMVGVGCLFVSEKISLTKPNSFVTTADARIGRPLTPLSYAGVARRTTRRAVAAGAVAAGAVYAAPVVVAPAVVPVCRQVVDVYGRVVTVCR